MSRIVWLASYPKSGNTWFRIFLANLLSPDESPVDINALESRTFSGRWGFDHASGWETSDLAAEEADRMRLGVQEVMAAEPEVLYFKVHEAFTDPRGNKPLFSLNATRAALYLIRNPLDVVVSLSHHIGKTVDKTIEFMNKPDATLASGGDRLIIQLSQPVRDWSGHVRSWVDAPELPILVLRYEDMRAASEATFLKACLFLGLPNEPEKVARALEKSKFETLQRQERERGFAEALPGRQFFREGRSGGWRRVLSSAQIQSIVERHGEVMRRFGYLNADGSLPD